MKKFIISQQNKGNKSRLNNKVEDACDFMEEIYDRKIYPKLIVRRESSQHNPVIAGEFARPHVYRWYLFREIKKIIKNGGSIEIIPSREIVSPYDPVIFDSIDEDTWDLRQKKLFLFKPERIELSLDRLEHYTGTDISNFQRYILFTNYTMHIDIFKNHFPDAVAPKRRGVQMPAYHYKMKDNLGVSIINIGVGPSNAKTITDHIAVLRPDAMIMVGHCGGLRNHQNIGDYVIASGYMRDDKVLDEMVPLNVPIIPNFLLNSFLRDQLKKNRHNFRIGIVFTTENRNWEFSKNRYEKLFSVSRSMAIDMESATIATNGFRYRIPHATLLAISDKPLHGKPKMNQAAQKFYQISKEKHLDIVLEVINQCRKKFPHGFPNDIIRGRDEPLFGGS